MPSARKPAPPLAPSTSLDARVVPPDERAPSASGVTRGTVVDHEDLIAPDAETWGDLG